MKLLQPRSATGTTHLMYPAFVAMFDQLTEERAHWHLYNPALTVAHASRGLSLLCFHDQMFWFTKKRLVFAIFMESYCNVLSGSSTRFEGGVPITT